MLRTELDTSLAARFAAVALSNVDTLFPAKLDHVLAEEGDALPPRALHPAFFGSFDWHSCVHMHWLLARLRRLFPSLDARPAIDDAFERHFTQGAIEGECAYLARAHSETFERPYGWTWLLELHRELAQDDDPDARRWSRRLAPLAAMIVERYRAWLPRADYPVRYGMHSNSAFGLAFALDHARATGDEAFEALLADKAQRWYGGDRDAPVAWEPSGFDFLSPALVEADLMRRVLGRDAYSHWLSAFLPGLAAAQPAALFTPARVSDRTDGHIVHLDGLNLSRAWCFRSIAHALGATDVRRAPLLEASETHLAAGLAGIESGGDYAGEHWLATYAVLALTE